VSPPGATAGRTLPKKIRTLSSCDPIMEEERISRVDPGPDLPLEMLEFPLPKHLWKADKKAKRCYCCDNKFRAFSRQRHHCRICGSVVCSVCSSYRLQNHRVCKNCKTDPATQRRFPDLAENKALAFGERASFQSSLAPTATFNMDIEDSGEEQAEEEETPQINPGNRHRSWSVNDTPPHHKGRFRMADDKKDSDSPSAEGKDRDGPANSDAGPRMPDELHRRHTGPFSDGFNDNRSTVSSIGDEKGVQSRADLSKWATRHCVRWLKSLRLGEQEEKTVDSMKDIGLSGNDLQGISDRDLMNELKIYSSILRRRILRNLRELDQDRVDAIVREDEEDEIQPLNAKEMINLARDVRILKSGKRTAYDRVLMLRSPENRFSVDWYPTKIHPGLHTITVIDSAHLKNSSQWVLKYDASTGDFDAHCLTSNNNALRWRLHNNSVELCTNASTVSDDLNTELILHVDTIILPDVSKVPVRSAARDSRTKPDPSDEIKRNGGTYSGGGGFSGF